MLAEHPAAADGHELGTREVTSVIDPQAVPGHRVGMASSVEWLSRGPGTPTASGAAGVRFSAAAKARMILEDSRSAREELVIRHRFAVVRFARRRS